MADIIITAGNPKHGDLPELRRFLWAGAEACLFRGARRADISEGDRVYLQDHGSLWGFVYFDRYDEYVGEDDDGQEVVKRDAMYVRAPMHRFDDPVDLRGVTANRGWRYVDPEKLGPETMSDLRRQTKAAEARPGWFGPDADYLQPDPDPFPDSAMRFVRMIVRDEAYRSTARQSVIEYIKTCIMEAPKGIPTYEAIAERVRADDWDEAVALTMCTLVDGAEAAVPPSVPVLRNGGYLYCDCAQMVCVGELDSGWRRRWRLFRNLDGESFVFDLFRQSLFDFEFDEALLEPDLLWRTARGDMVFGTNPAGLVFPLELVPSQPSRVKAAKPKAPKRGK